MKFMKVFWAALLAFFVANILMIILTIMIFAGISAAMSESIPTVAKDTVLEIDFSNGVSDSPVENPLKTSSMFNLSIDRSNTILQVVRALERAKTDNNIKGIYLRLRGGASMSLANAEEVRAAIVDFKKESGKFVVSYSEGYSQAGYYLCSVADQIYLNPEGEITWSGLSASVMFYKGLMDKLGIQADIIRVGSFKAAVEPFMLNKMSSENQLQMSTMLNSVWGTMLHDVSASRGIDSTVLSNYATELSLRVAEDALKYGFIDKLVYEDQVMEAIKQLSTGVVVAELNFDQKSEDKEGEKQVKKSRFMSLQSYISATEPYNYSSSKNVVAIVYADGSIVDGKSGEGSIGGETIAKKLAKVRKDDKIKALVLRINSPGGSAMASDVMWRELELIREIKPVIISMGGLAASGGYYIAAPGDLILANRTTLTGSIGVFGLMLNVSKGMKEKLGLSVDVVNTNPSADMGSIFRGLTVRERGIIQEGVNRVYSTFIGHVADGRNMSVEQVDKIGGGRIWSGVNAKEIGLVDDFGGIKEAIAIAAERADIVGDFRVREIVEKPDALMLMMIDMLGGVKVPNNTIEGELGEMFIHYNAIKQMTTEQGIHARMPYIIDIK